MKKFLCVLFILLFSTTLFAETKISEGTAVFAEWSTNGWYHGKVSTPKDGGYLILFDDGDRKVCTMNQIVLDQIPKKSALSEGTAVLAKWSNGRFYPGKINAKEGKGKYSIHFDDGDKATVSIKDIRVRNGSSSSKKQSESQKTSAPKIVSRDFKIWWDGSSWAEITTNGKIWIGGSRVGELEADGDIYKDGSRVGELEPDGDIYINGSQDAEIESDGDLYYKGSRIAEIEKDGDIYFDGSNRGEADPFSGELKDIQAVAVILIFFLEDE